MITSTFMRRSVVGAAVLLLGALSALSWVHYSNKDKAMLELQRRSAQEADLTAQNIGDRLTAVKPIATHLPEN